MKTTISILVLFFAFCHVGQSQERQDSTTLVQIETTDGNSHIGKIVFEDGEKITLATEKLGSLTFKKADVAKVTPIKKSQLVDGKFWFENPQASRYFFSGNGYGLKKGEAYYQNVWVLFNQFSFGVTDNFSVGAGI